MQTGTPADQMNDKSLFLSEIQKTGLRRVQFGGLQQ